MADFYLAEPQLRPTLPTDYQWINEQGIHDYALPRLVEKLLEKLPTSK
jgi:A/G-specific adenine glycosylase